MPRIQSLARVIRSFKFRKNSNSTKSTKSRSALPTLIAAIALFALVAFSVSVESRSGGWLRKAEPGTPAANLEVAKNSSPRSGAAKSTVVAKPTFVAPFAPTVTATKTDALITDVDMDGKADPGDTLKYTVVIGAIR